MTVMDKTHRDLLFYEARTHRHWLDQPVSDETLRELYGLLRMPPTEGNSQPTRIVFVKSPAAKAKLKPALDPGNVASVMAASVTAIIAHDLGFATQMPKLGPRQTAAMQSLAPDVSERVAFRSATLQAGYLILAARGLGLDCGPMSGFDREAVDRLFFPDGQYKSSMIVNLGYGNAERLHPRAARLSFEEACRIE